MKFISNGREEIYFVQWSDSRYVSHSQGQASCLEVVVQHKIWSICLCDFCFVLLTFIILLFLIVCFAYLSENEKEYEVGGLGGRRS